MYSNKTEIQGKKEKKIALLTRLRPKKDVNKY